MLHKVSDLPLSLLLSPSFPPLSFPPLSLSFPPLPPSSLPVLTQCFTTRSNCELYPENSVIVQQGDGGSEYYVILQGNATIHVESGGPNLANIARLENAAFSPGIRAQMDEIDPPPHAKVRLNSKYCPRSDIDSYYGAQVGALGEYQSFGELALLSAGGTRAVTIITSEPTYLMVMNKGMHCLPSTVCPQLSACLNCSPSTTVCLSQLSACLNCLPCRLN